MTIYFDREMVPGFRKELQKIQGENLRLCYQCGKCTAGCALAPNMEYTPNQIILMLQLGLKEKLLNANSYWICTSCGICSQRCPRGVDVAHMMDSLRNYHFKHKTSPKEKNYMIFAEAFLGTVEKYGRLHELSLMAMYNIKSRDLFNQAKYFPSLVQNKKIAFRPHKIKNSKEVAQIIREFSGEKR